jgi:hypothetical protein
MVDDYDYFTNKRPDRIYISKRLQLSPSVNRDFRIASKVMDSTETYQIVREHGEYVIRATEGGRQEIIAKFVEDTRGVFILIIQRFTPTTGEPHKISFSFRHDEIPKLLGFLERLRTIDVSNPDNFRLQDDPVANPAVNVEDARSLLSRNPDLILELAKSEITKQDIIALGFRRQQLEEFEKLLNKPEYFSQRQTELETTAEGVWQKFFEKNRWVFGYGLTYLHLAGFDDAQLEQIAIGYDLTGPGKRADAVMNTRGLINALCFVEIKTHATALLGNKPYRSGCWAPSGELSGGVAQLQGTVALITRKYTERLDAKNELGDRTGHTAFTHHPKSFLIVGSLGEFVTEHGVNEERYRSFEIFRRNIIRPEIITFDELYQRAKLIVEHPDG